MIRNNFRIAFRNLTRHKVFTLITIVGLSVGMTAFLLIIQYVRFERSYEDFHAKSANIYRITLDLYKGAEYIVTDCETHAPLGATLREQMPEVKDFVRMYHYDALQDIRVGTEKFLDEGLYFTDQSVFNIFSLHMLAGNESSSLTVPFTAVLTESTAKKYFGNHDPLGRSIKVNGIEYTVSGVIADLPPNTHIKFKIFLSHPTQVARHQGYSETDWSGNNEYTYLLMEPATDLQAFNAKLRAFSVKMKDKLNGSIYQAQPMRDIHLYSNKTYEPEVNGNARTVYFLLIIACFIIVIAWVNYINLSTSRALERAREVGIRKVMGSVQSQLIRQFLTEAVLISVIAGIVACLGCVVLMPAFRELSGTPIPSDFYADPFFWYLLSALSLGGALMAGAYPAFVLSSFDPAKVLKGKFQTSSHGQFLRKTLVIFQFSATVVLMICMATVFLQIRFLRKADLGLSMDQTLVIRAPRLDAGDSVFKQSFNSFRSAVLQHPEMKMMTRSGSLPGLSLHELSSNTVARLGKETDSERGEEFYFYRIDADFINAMNMQLVVGRNFEPDVPNYDQVIINEEGVRRLGFSSPEEALGQRLTFRTRWPGEPARIIGVMKNFYQRSPKEAHIPMLLEYGESADYFSVKIQSANMESAVAAIREDWKAVYPDFIFDSFFLDERFGQQYRSDMQFGRVITVFSCLAVFVACLGLFGLSSYTIVQRTREIGIRKVLGASVGEIVTLLSGEFAKVVLIAGFIAIPLGYVAMKEWLSHYAVRVSMNVWIFILPVVFIILIALLTVSVQTIRSALANPTKALKTDV